MHCSGRTQPGSLPRFPLARLGPSSADAPRLPRETLAFREELDVLKFLCKDLWVAVFQKQMDSLRTNHQVCAHAQPAAWPQAQVEPSGCGRGTPMRGGCGRLAMVGPGHTRRQDLEEAAMGREALSRVSVSLRDGAGRRPRGWRPLTLA